MLLWDFDYPLQKAIRNYMEVGGPDIAIPEIDYSRTIDPFHYSCLTTARQQVLKQAAVTIAEKEEAQRRPALRTQLTAGTRPFGMNLAA